MKIFIFTTALILIACIAYAGNIDGKWEGFPSSHPDIKYTFTFKSDGKKLTGTMIVTGKMIVIGTIGPGKNGIDIQNGKIEGNRISFEISVKNPAYTGTTFYTGELSGDDLKLSWINKLELNPDSKLEIEEPEGPHSHTPPQTTIVCKRVKNGE